MNPSVSLHPKSIHHRLILLLSGHEAPLCPYTLKVIQNHLILLLPGHEALLCA